MATSRLQLEGDDSVHLHITHANLKSFSADVRFSPQVSLQKNHYCFLYVLLSLNTFFFWILL